MYHIFFLVYPSFLPFLLCATKRLNDICRPLCFFPLEQVENTSFYLFYFIFNLCEPPEAMASCFLTSIVLLLIFIFCYFSPGSLSCN